MEPITTSKAINALISYNDPRLGWEEFKKNIETEFDKWFFNTFNPDAYHGSSKDEYKTDFDPSKITTELFDKYVPVHGRCQTSYGEFIRAMNKIMYRWLNDGDDPIYGPYNMLVDHFLDNYSGDRYFRLHDGCLELRKPWPSDFDSDQIQNLQDVLSFALCVFEDHPAHAEETANILFAVLDCLNDKFKGLEDHNDVDCSEYYKNSAEDAYPQIYKFITDNLKLYNIRAIQNGYWNDIDIEEIDNIISIKTKSDNEFQLTVRRFDNDKREHEYHKFMIQLDKPDPEMIKKIKELVEQEEKRLIFCGRRAH